MKQPNYYGHRERLKEQFVKDGMNNMHSHHIIEMLLFYAIPRKDTKELAHALLNRFGSISGVFDADITQLVEVKGISMHSAILIKMIPQLAKVYLEDKSEENHAITDVKQAGKYLIPKFLGECVEKTYLICLNKKGGIIFSEFIHEGSVSATEISSRKVAETAVRVGATTVIVAHNHPNNFALPSRADIIATDNLKDTLKQVGVVLLDHIIVSDNDFTSMAESGLIQSSLI